ncbi:MAG: hypothetical protein OXT65_12510 [Alphaproteobacteria bacterium]|nr:hypothetical protein [Alphaproteobacteria bacterium]
MSVEAPFLVFFILHLVIGAVLPARGDTRPLLARFFEGIVDAIAQRLDRLGRSRGVLFVRGAVVALVLSAAVLWAGRWLESLVSAQSTLSFTLYLVFLLLAVDVMAGVKAAQKLSRTLTQDDFKKADGHTQARQMLGDAALCLSLYFTGPVLALVLGLDVALLYVLLAAFYRVLFLRGAFGFVAVGLHQVLNFIPAVCAVLLVAAASLFVAGANMLRVFKVSANKGWRTEYGVTGWPLAALAGALNVTLGGPPCAWVGPKGSSAKVIVENLKAAALLQFIVYIFFAALFSGAVAARHIFA